MILCVARKMPRLDAAHKGKSDSVDDAARAVITSGGFRARTTNLHASPRHGIGLDGHEHPYLVRGSKTVLAPGMTFPRARHLHPR